MPLLFKIQIYVLLVITSSVFNYTQAQEMIKVKGGQIEIGYKEGLDNEKPSFQTILRSFLIDKNLVTVGQFRLFAKINRYITDAERTGKGYAFDSLSQTLKPIEGAYWAYPSGTDQAQAKTNEPVRQVSWQDAQAYANWIGKRLPNEYELELATKNAEELGIQQLDGTLWQWSDNWYQRYDASEYYKSNLNREKTLKAGSLPDSTVFRATLRSSAVPIQSRYDIGFRCAKDIKP